MRHVICEPLLKSLGIHIMLGDTMQPLRTPHRTSRSRRALLFTAVAGVIAMALTSAPASAQAWRSKPVKLLVPLAAGSTTGSLRQIDSGRHGQVDSDRQALRCEGGLKMRRAFRYRAPAMRRSEARRG